MITCITNGKIYIGSTYNFDFRIKEHKNLLKKNKHRNSSLQKDFNEFGESKFLFELVEFCSNYLEREQWFIKFFKPDYNKIFVRSIIYDKKYIEKFKKQIIIEDNGCWSFRGNKKSYTSVKYFFKKSTTFHRLSYYIFNGEFPEYLKVLHSCNNKWCGNPKHLSVGTDRENRTQASNDGIGCKLNLEIVKYIRLLATQKVATLEIQNFSKKSIQYRDFYQVN
jgi:group I intron endonuclease